MINIRTIDATKTIDAKATQNIRSALLQKAGSDFPAAGPDRVYWVALCTALANCPAGEALILNDAIQDFVNRAYGAVMDGTADVAVAAVAQPI